MIAPMEQPDISVRLFGRVVRVRPHESGQWVFGCELVHPLAEHEIRELLEGKKPT